MMSLSRGHDPRDFALFAFGGAGPLHATALARELGIPRVMIPPRPGITNAIGCVVADLRHDYVRTLNRPLDALDMSDLRAVFDAQAVEGEALIGAETLRLKGTRRVHSVDMQFVGQTHLIRVPIDDPAIDKDVLRAVFDQVYFRRFRVELPQVRVNLVNANTSVIGARADIDLSTLIDPAGRRATLAEAQRAVRAVYFEDGWRDTAVYRRDLLPLDAVIEGPAVIEQMDTTSLIEPGCVARSDTGGNLMVEVG
jgi:N-methylhydantoinase A